MKAEEIKDGAKVRNLKYGNEEIILHTGIMKLETGWMDCVIYQGEDRFGGGVKVFAKRLEDFLTEFELL